MVLKSNDERGWPVPFGWLLAAAVCSLRRCQTYNFPQRPFGHGTETPDRFSFFFFLFLIVQKLISFLYFIFILFFFRFSYLSCLSLSLSLTPARGVVDVDVFDDGRPPCLFVWSLCRVLFHFVYFFFVLLLLTESI